MNFRFPWNKVDTDHQVLLSYDAHRNNFGDILSPIIADYYGSKKIKRISKRRSRRVEHYLMIGSILQRCTRYSIVWGSGFISSDSICKEIPKKVLAVRGPLTREKLISQGVDCPKIYGDPALLLPEIYPCKDQIVKYKLGIIPHFNDKGDSWLKNGFDQDPEIKIIDIQNKDPLKVVDDIMQCERIISSSLHGVIVADAYKVPSVWVEFSIPLEGGGFKFQDYFTSVGRSVEAPVLIRAYKSLNEILNIFDDYEINIDLEALKNSFPF